RGGGLEELDGSARRLDGLLISAEAIRDCGSGVPGPGGPHLVAVLLGLGGRPLVVGEGLSALAAIAGLPGPGTAELILARCRRRRLLGLRLLGLRLSELPLALAALSFRGRRQSAGQREEGQEHPERPRQIRHRGSILTDFDPVASLRPLTIHSGLDTISPAFRSGRCVIPASPAQTRDRSAHS